VNRLGQVAALAALADHAHEEKTVRLVLEERAYLSAELTKRGYTFPPSHANFLLIAVPDAPGIRARLMRAGILVRDGAGVGFPGPPLGAPLVLGGRQPLQQIDHPFVDGPVPVAHREVRRQPLRGEVIGDGALVAVDTGRLRMRLQMTEALVAVGIDPARERVDPARERSIGMDATAALVEEHARSVLLGSEDGAARLGVA